MAKRINFKAALKGSKESGAEIVYNTYGMPGVVFVESRRKDGVSGRVGWLSVEYVKKERRRAGLAPQFKDISKNE